MWGECTFQIGNLEPRRGNLIKDPENAVIFAYIGPMIVAAIVRELSIGRVPFDCEIRQTIADRADWSVRDPLRWIEGDTDYAKVWLEAPSNSRAVRLRNHLLNDWDNIEEWRC